MGSRALRSVKPAVLRLVCQKSLSIGCDMAASQSGQMRSNSDQRSTRRKPAASRVHRPSQHSNQGKSQSCTSDFVNSIMVIWLSPKLPSGQTSPPKSSPQPKQDRRWLSPYVQSLEGLTATLLICYNTDRSLYPLLSRRAGNRAFA